MVNIINNLYKIGRSDNPTSREKTLQSQEPEISLLRSWVGTTKDEVFLHEHFAAHRVRGEWFKLDASQIESLYGLMHKRTVK